MIVRAPASGQQQPAAARAGRKYNFMNCSVQPSELQSAGVLLIIITPISCHLYPCGEKMAGAELEHRQDSKLCIIMLQCY